MYQILRLNGTWLGRTGTGTPDFMLSHYATTHMARLHYLAYSPMLWSCILVYDSWCTREIPESSIRLYLGPAPN